jgi:PleD family two-component response regulator
MGLVAIGTDGPARADFASLYSRCDRLLYEAKAQGRNRTVRERLRGFPRHRAAA